MTLKEAVYNECCRILNNKITALQQTLVDLRESASNETKSTAGDKYETSLAMLQIEQENTLKQLENLLSQKQTIEKIDPALKPVVIANGTLVETSKGYFFISIALGKVIVEGREVIALSPQSPLGIKFTGQQPSDAIEMNGIVYEIKKIS